MSTSAAPIGDWSKPPSFSLVPWWLVPALSPFRASSTKVATCSSAILKMIPILMYCILSESIIPLDQRNQRMGARQRSYQSLFLLQCNRLGSYHVGVYLHSGLCSSHCEQCLSSPLQCGWRSPWEWRWETTNQLVVQICLCMCFGVLLKSLVPYSSFIEDRRAWRLVWCQPPNQLLWSHYQDDWCGCWRYSGFIKWINLLPHWEIEEFISISSFYTVMNRIWPMVIWSFAMPYKPISWMLWPPY